MPIDPWTVARLVLLIGMGGGFALLLWRAGLAGGRPAAAIAGGLVAGILLGPAVLGSAMPRTYQSLFIGGLAEHDAVESARHRHGIELQALYKADVSPVAREELAAMQAAELGRLILARDKAEARFREPASFWAVGWVGLALGLGLWAGSRPGANQAKTLRVEVGALASAGLGAVAISVLMTAVLISWLLRVGPAWSVMVGAAAASGSAFGGLPTRWVGADGRRGRGKVFGLAGLVGAVLVLALLMPGDGARWLMIPIAGAGTGLIVGATFPPNSHALRRGRRLARGVILWLLIPALVAYVVSLVDWRLVTDEPRSLVLVIAWGVLAGDAHLVGGWLGLLSFGWTRAHLVCIETLSLGFGLTSVCLTAVLVASGVLDPATTAGAACVAGLVIAALTPELLLGTNRRMGAQLAAG